MDHFRQNIGTLIFTILCLAGCNNQPGICVVAGSVTYQGKPIAKGEIVFADAKNIAPAAFGKIEDGKYQVSTLAGEKKIRITAMQETGKTIDGAMGVKYPERVDLIPPKYNSATTLTRVVEPKARGILDFHLE